jgi:hypothetical protein
MAGRAPLAVIAVIAVGAGCGPEASDGSPSTTVATTTTVDEQRFPDVVDVAAERLDDGTWTFRVTISSPYDTPERYADGWRVVGPEGTVYGEHRLTHDHANEQPFTRTQRGVTIPDDVTEVTIEARDQRYGYGGITRAVTLATD